jgi:hypothetical protein
VKVASASALNAKNEWNINVVSLVRRRGVRNAVRRCSVRVLTIMNCSGRNGPIRTSRIEGIEQMKCQSITGAFGLVGLLLLISPSFAVEDKAFTESKENAPIIQYKSQFP